MPTQFPGALDNFTNPVYNNKLNSPSHSGQHADENDAIEAIEAYLGVTGSAVTSTVSYKLSTITGSNTALTSGMIDTDGTLAANSDSKIATQKAVKTYVDNQSNSTISNSTIINPTIVNWDGWCKVSDSWSYSSADSPTFVITVPTGAASKYSAGMKIKLTQSTVKYFVVTAVADTTLTVYGGTDYTLTNAAISDIFYSSQRAPLGFPLDKNKWMVKFSSNTPQFQASPTASTWYNPGSQSITIPIGVWDVDYSVNLLSQKAAGEMDVFSTLSSSSNSESDDELTNSFSFGLTDGNWYINVVRSNKEKTISLASKTVYYLNCYTTTATMANIGFGGASKNIIRAKCAYI